MPESLQIVEITCLEDERLLPWLDIYQIAFPPSEQMLTSYFLRLLKQPGERTEYMLAGLDGETVVGLAHYVVRAEGRRAEGRRAEERLAGLWGLAVATGMRNRGWGAQLYREVVQRCAGMRALLLEVEIPATLATPEARALAERRIGFYRRLGAKLLGGITYRQTVGPHQPPIPMHLMLHPLEQIAAPKMAAPKMAASEAFALAQQMFGQWVEQTGALSLE